MKEPLRQETHVLSSVEPTFKTYGRGRPTYIFNSDKIDNPKIDNILVCFKK